MPWLALPLTACLFLPSGANVYRAFHGLSLSQQSSFFGGVRRLDRDDGAQRAICVALRPNYSWLHSWTCVLTPVLSSLKSGAL